MPDEEICQSFAGKPGKIPGILTDRVLDGGADRARTCDLLIANETLYQLSYDPIHVCCK